MKLPYGESVSVRLTSPFGNRVDPISGAGGSWHGGVDLVGDGDKTVRAVASGNVWISRIITDPANRTSEWGNYVCIAGDDGILYYYCHLKERLVVAGERIEAGCAIGIEGSTGKSTGSHLHFECRRGGVQIDPTKILGIPNACGVYISAVDDERNTGGEIMVEVNEKKDAQRNDSEPSEWARDAVDWAVDAGIICGDENGDLMLRKNATREQMMVFLYRLAQFIGEV